MPELRRDPIIDRWVIIAENRGARPGAFVAGMSLGPPPREAAFSPLTGAIAPHATEVCPFCPGNEHETPPATFVLHDETSRPDVTGWRVRIVPNKYPALLAEKAALAEPPPGRAGSSEPLLCVRAAAVGVHEVIVDTPRHIMTVGELSDRELTDSLAATRLRLQALRGQTDLAHALVFRNVGRAAGSTREHVHGQLMATRQVASLVRAELAGAKQYFDEHRQCVFCRVIEDELAHHERVVCESPAFVALCPFASRLPYETWILPKRHASHFEQIAVEDLADLASLTRGTIAKIERLSQPPAYNLIFHSSPFDSLSIEHYHWHIEIIPRLTIPAGFEWGSGWTVNPVSPETAAGVLRAMDG
jgi:UDPglucose--hexose-1-phosphate uridylyltransferase